MTMYTQNMETIDTTGKALNPYGSHIATLNHLSDTVMNDKIIFESVNGTFTTRESSNVVFTQSFSLIHFKKQCQPQLFSCRAFPC